MAPNSILLDKLCALELCVLKNCQRLHRESITLYRAKCYCSAFFISVIGLEELGKVLLIDDVGFHLSSEDWDRSTASEWLKGITNHRAKQHYPFADKFPTQSSAMKNFVKGISDGSYDKDKQNSLYVGLKNNSIDGEILVPKVTRSKSKKQILLLNSLLLETVRLKFANQVYFEFEEVNGLLTKKFQCELEDIAHMH